MPAGATPKEGPSAGIALISALVSLFTGRPVKNGLAMTGEITLRGRQLRGPRQFVTTGMADFGLWTHEAEQAGFVDVVSFHSYDGNQSDMREGIASLSFRSLIAVSCATNATVVTKCGTN